MVHVIAALLFLLQVMPIIVPPKHMVRTAAHGRSGQFLEEFRGTFKTTWMGRTYTNSAYIRVLLFPGERSAAEAAMIDVFGLANPPAKYAASASKFTLLASHSVRLCNGERGWLAKYRQGDMTAVEVFARGRDGTYVAHTSWDTETGDRLRTEASLMSLCAPSPAAPDPPALDAPFRLPSPWINVSSFDQFSATGLGKFVGWIRLDKKLFLEGVLYARLLDTLQFVSPKQGADNMVEQSKGHAPGFRVLFSRKQNVCVPGGGWTLGFQAEDPRGYAYTVQDVYAYADDAMYMLRYFHRASDPPDPQAVSALKSFCPR